MEKVCVNHPESPAVGSCKACEKPVCLMCIVEVQGVSFCSEACGSAYQEVKDWLERPAAEEEWNPLAEGKAAVPAAPAPAPQKKAAPPPPKPAAAAKPPVPSQKQMHDALAEAFAEPPAPPPPPKPKAAEEPPPPPVERFVPQPARQQNLSLYIGIAATVLVIIGAYFLLVAGQNPPTPVAVNTEPPKPPPPRPEPPKPEPVKPPPPKPEPVKPEPPKPEPVKPQPKPEPVKPPPPKPEPAKPEPPKPEPVKPEPVKPPPPKPEPVKPPPPKPEPPKVEVAKPEPPPAPHLAFLRDPWGKEKPGAWYRVKTVEKGQESYRDIGLRESGAGYRVLVSQTSAGGKTEPEQFTWTEPEETSLVGSVNGDAQGTKYAADVVRMKSSRPSQYVFRDDPHAGISFPSDAVLTRLDLQQIKVKDRAFSCSVIETELRDPKRVVRTWSSVQFPLGAVKSESEGTTTALVDFGDDWAKRPPFPQPPVIAKPEPPKPEPPKPEPVKPPPPPPPKPEPPKVDVSTRVKKSMNDAAGLIREAAPLYAELAGAMNQLPDDAAALRELAGMADRLSLKLGDARLLYTSVKPDAPDPSVVDRRLAQLDELLASVEECRRELKKRIQ